jgi:CRP/FNR family transcriptional regulator
MTTLGMSGGSARAPISGPDAGVLRRAGLLERIPEEDVEALLPKFQPVAAARGQVIFRERDNDEGNVYVVLDGRVGLERRDDRDHSTMLAVLGPSEMFGELSALDPGPRTSTATALMPTRLAMLGAEDLLDWATHRPVIARQLLRVLARRLRRTNDTVAGLVFVDVPGRVAGAVLDLAGRFGEPTDQGLRVRHALTQDQLAQLVGASRETVNKVLANFSARGWLILESRSLVLRDVEAVRKRARQAAGPPIT